MTSAAEIHQRLLVQVLRGRRRRSLPEESENLILEEMADLWWQMTEPEQEEAERLAARMTRLRPPDDAVGPLRFSPASVRWSYGALALRPRTRARP